VESIDAFEELASAWRKLADQIPSCDLSQTYDWCYLSLKHRISHPEDKIHCVTAWDNDQLVAVWPFIQRQEAGKPKRLDPVGCGLKEEYADPLLAPIAADLESCKQLLKAAMRGTDIFYAQFLKSGSNMHKAMEASRCVRYATTIDAFEIDRRSAPSWDAFMAAYPSKLRVRLRGARRKLREQGVASFELADGASEQIAVIDWILYQKRTWLTRREKSQDWFSKPEAREFLVEAAGQTNGIGRIGVFALKLDGVTMAAAIVTIDRERIAGYITTFDPTYARFSPGNLLVQDVAQWGYERQLKLDMRILRSDYKERWASESSTRVSYFLLPSLRGVVRFGPVLLRYRAMAWLETKLPQEEVARLKSFAKRHFSLVRP
jgi:CelD/BcsL family acetyltransferase involved in cellulose biosynthesis